MFPLQMFVLFFSILLGLALFCWFNLGFFAFNCSGSKPSTESNPACEQFPHNCGGNSTEFYLKYPFRFEGDPSSCGEPNFELSCQRNRTVWQDYMSVEPKNIDYENQTFRVVNLGFQNDDDYCSPLPYSSVDENSIDPSSPVQCYFRVSQEIVFVRCKNPVKQKSKKSKYSTLHYIDTNEYCNTSSSSYNYVVVGQDLGPGDIEDSCTIIKILPSEFDDSLLVQTRNLSFQDVHNLLSFGFQVGWIYPALSRQKNFLCQSIAILDSPVAKLNLEGEGDPEPYPWHRGAKVIALLMLAKNGIGILLLLAFLIYKWRRRHLSMYDNIEDFLQANNGLMPIRYSYREIKSITNNFRDKLGEGGYGLVYKGKLRSGYLVAVKMLNKSKANGQEFINEVATIGRIHHVNVVRLVGFCVTASKRALIYDYMRNGSLDKFIFSATSSNGAISLSLKQAFEIATGVARGIEYLHQGCNIQILHFDIKPHNILLDESFVPKVSDFGLAKFYPKQSGSVATLTTVGGTLGYMAPELFYKKIGKVSYKSDVYSFGMLLLEMAGRRKNFTYQIDHSSQMYFPSWIYDKLDQGEEIEIGDKATEEEKHMRKKLVMIALWCIQMKPDDRPSMRQVLVMLEGDIKEIPLPPEPSFHPPDSPAHFDSGYSSSEESTEALIIPSAVTLEIE